MTLWSIAHQAPLSMGLYKQEYWSGLPLPSPGDLPNLGIKSTSLALKTDSLPSEPPGKLFSSVQSLSHVQLFATPWTTACQASLSITNPRSLFKLMSIKSVMPSNHLILCHPFLLLPSIFPGIRVVSNDTEMPLNETLRLPEVSFHHK